MKEQEYIDATNLAKVRIAKDIIRDMLFCDPDVVKVQKMLMGGLRLIEEGIKIGKLK